MRRFVEGADRGQTTLFPECLEDWIGADNTVRVIDVFVEELDLAGLGFGGFDPESDRPALVSSVRSCCSSTSTAILTGFSRADGLSARLGATFEAMWLTGRLAPDHKTIADFRKDNGTRHSAKCARASSRCAARWVCSRKPASSIRRQQVQGGEQPRQELHARQDEAAHGADRGECRAAIPASSTAPTGRAVRGAQNQSTSRLKEKIEKLKEQMRRLEDLKVQMLATLNQQISLTDPDSRSTATSGRGSGAVGYNVQVAVDAKHHLIIAHEATNIGLIGRSLHMRPTKPRRRWTWRSSMPSPTVVTSTAKKSWMR